MKPHSILMFLDTGELGGGNIVSIQLAQLLAAYGHQISIYSDQGPAREVVEKAGLPWRYFDQRGLLTCGKLQTRWREWRLYRELNACRPDVVYVSSAFLYGLLGRTLSSLKTRKIGHVQIEQQADEWRWAYRFRPDRIITCARYLVPGVMAAIGNEPPVVAVPNAIDHHAFCPGDRQQARATLGYTDPLPLLLMLANLAPHKGQRTAVQAVALLRQRGWDVNLWLAGIERDSRQEFTQQLRKEIVELGVQDRVTLLGQRRDSPVLLQAADLFLLPSTNEGLPLSILEAQSVGTPVLASSVAGIPDIIKEGETGFMIDPGQPALYADRIMQMIREPEQARSISERSRRFILEQHTLEAFGKRFEQEMLTGSPK